MVCADFGLSRFLPEHEEFCCRTGKPMTNLPPKLEAALTAAADALADLPAETWDALCREEAAELIAAHQYFAAVGFAVETVRALLFAFIADPWLMMAVRRAADHVAAGGSATCATRISVVHSTGRGLSGCGARSAVV